jgi:peptidoglycan/LPS O-acetylase OafA/YrhL
VTRRTANRVVAAISTITFWMIIAAFVCGPENSPWPYFIGAAALLLMVVGITINVRYNVEEK